MWLCWHHIALSTGCCGRYNSNYLTHTLTFASLSTITQRILHHGFHHRVHCITFTGKFHQYHLRPSFLIYKYNPQVRLPNLCLELNNDMVLFFSYALERVQFSLPHMQFLSSPQWHRWWARAREWKSRARPQVSLMIEFLIWKRGSSWICFF